MERQHVDPLWKLFSFRYGGADIDEVVANGLSGLAQSSDIGVRDYQLHHLGRVVIKPLVQLCLLKNFPGHLFWADRLAEEGVMAHVPLCVLLNGTVYICNLGVQLVE